MEHLELSEVFKGSQGPIEGFQRFQRATGDLEGVSEGHGGVSRGLMDVPLGHMGTSMGLRGSRAAAEGLS